jgi:hypothetical protein
VLLLGPLLGEDSVVVIALFLVALLPGALLAFLTLASASVLLAVAGLVTMVLAPWGFVLLPEAQILGVMPARGAVPAAGLARSVTVGRSWQATPLRGTGTRRMTEHGTFTVAPLLPPGWQPGEAVRAVALAAHHGPHAAPGWAPQGGLVPLRPSALRDLAARRALIEAGLVPAADITIGRWSAEPWRERLEEARGPLAGLGGGLVAWAAMVLLATLMQRRGGGGTPPPRHA